VTSRNSKVNIDQTIILPVVLCGFETRSLIIRGECRLRVFQNRVLGRIFRPNRDEVTRVWSKLHDEELHNLCCLPNIIWMIIPRKMS
jgi:hypothetical protein